MNPNEYLGIFVDDAHEHLQLMNQGLLTLEKNPASRAALEDVFRAAHTLKGMSATMGFKAMATLTHRMESALEEMRSGRMEVTTARMNVLFGCLDALEGGVNRVARGEEEPPTEGLVAELETLTSGGGDTKANCGKGGVTPAAEVAAAKDDSDASSELDAVSELERDVIRQAVRRGYNVFDLRIVLASDCVLKSARVYLVMHNLESEGEVIKARPPVEDLEEERFGQEFALLYVTRLPESEVRGLLESISEIQAVEIMALKVEDAAETIENGRGDELEEESKGKSLEAVVAAARAVAAAAEAGPGGKGPNIVQGGQTGHQAIRQTVRVEIGKLDMLMNLVGELVINRSRLAQIGASQRVPALQESIEELARITFDLQNVVMKARMVPIEHVFSRFPRMVRDLATSLGKDVEFLIEGAETELDRTVVDEIGDPLLHLLRNAIDHGIETPRERLAAGKPAKSHLRLSAHHEGNQVMVELADDGRGIDLDKVRQKAVERGLVDASQGEELNEHEVVEFLFLNGFSTADRVSDVSGRGVGLDVVRTKIGSLNGSVEVATRAGEGTVFTIKLPLTLAIIQALLVGLGEKEIYALPLENIEEIVKVQEGGIKTIRGREHILFRDQVVPILCLGRLFATPDSAGTGSRNNVVVVKAGRRRLGLLVDRLIGQQEIVIKPLDGLLASVPGFAGATILGDGMVALILDVLNLEGETRGAESRGAESRGSETRSGETRSSANLMERVDKTA